MKNIDLKRMNKITRHRKSTIATWKPSNDPRASTIQELRMENALGYMKAFRKKHKQPCIILHLVIKAVAEALRQLPEANALIRFNKIYYRLGVTIGVTVVDDDGELYNIRVLQADKKSLLDIVKETRVEVKRVKNTNKNGTNSVHVPNILLRPFLSLASFLMFKLNIHLPFMGFSKDAFGVAEITYIGALGLDKAIPTLTPHTNVPYVIAPGVIKDAPVVENQEVRVGKVMNLNMSFDHRYIDGFHGAKFINILQQYLENPFEHFDDVSIDE